MPPKDETKAAGTVPEAGAGEEQEPLIEGVYLVKASLIGGHAAAASLDEERWTKGRKLTGEHFAERKYTLAQVERLVKLGALERVG